MASASSATGAVSAISRSPSISALKPAIAAAERAAMPGTSAGPASAWAKVIRSRWA